MKKDDASGFGEADEAIEAWGGDTSQKVRIRNGVPSVAHIPFYKFAYYPDVLDLRKAGYEIDNFAEIFDQLDDAHVRHAQIAHILLHLPTDEFGRMGDGSGGAVAFATANRIAMLEHSIYSVISPEGCASILWKDAEKMREAAEALRRQAGA